MSGFTEKGAVYKRGLDRVYTHTHKCNLTENQHSGRIDVRRKRSVAEHEGRSAHEIAP